MSSAHCEGERTLVLIRLYQSGNRAAGEELFARCYPKVQRIVRIRARARGFDVEAVEDLVQATFLDAARSFADFEPREEGALVQWLARIAEREILDELRKRQSAKRDPARELPLRSDDSVASQPGLAASDLTAGTTSVPEKVARKELAALVEESLAELEEKQREVILLRRFAECSWEQVAQELGSPSPGAARKLYGRACAALDAAVKRRTKLT